MLSGNIVGGDMEETVLHVAARCGHCAIARFLLDESSGFNAAHARDSEGNTALHVAACYGSVAERAGSRPFLPLSFAVSYRKTRCVLFQRPRNGGWIRRGCVDFFSTLLMGMMGMVLAATSSLGRRLVMEAPTNGRILDCFLFFPSTFEM